MTGLSYALWSAVYEQLAESKQNNLRPQCYDELPVEALHVVLADSVKNPTEMQRKVIVPSFLF